MKNEDKKKETNSGNNGEVLDRKSKVVTTMVKFSTENI
jgi:hypothetical protein